MKYVKPALTVKETEKLRIEATDGCSSVPQIVICMYTPALGCPTGMPTIPSCSCGVSKSYCRTSA